MKFKGDIIITDPCYIFRDEDWDKYCNNFNSSFIKELGFTSYIWEDTIYGDWSCTTFEKGTRKKLGTFCADAGLVGVFLLDEVLKYNPKFDYHINNPYTCTLIKNFDGDIEYDSSNDKAKIIGSGNINFYTKQTAG